METVDADFVGRVIIGLLVITAPFDPVKLMFFNETLARRPQGRSRAALALAGYVAVILAVAALIGKELLEAMGVNLAAFGVVGGLVIAGMGFEMLYSGGASQAQGEAQREEGPQQNDGLLMPLAIPLIAGPGAITTTITFGSQNTSWAGLGAMGIAIAVVAAVTFVFYRFMGDLLARVKPATVAILARLGGLILATLGVQMVLSGLSNYFA